jgi:hypothetical protein
METIFGKQTKYGEADRRRNIGDGDEYEHLFPPAPGKVYTVKKNAGLTDTVVFIPKVVRQTQDQTKQFAAFIKGKTLQETCGNIWDFIYHHIQYKKDEKGYEQIRSPRRVWHDRATGVDCDCYSVFISSVLTNLRIPHILRITKYRENYFQHIYPIVPTPSGFITIDCVANQYNFEVPYSEKKDFTMDLQYLDGMPGDYPIADDLNEMGMGDLGKKGFLKNLQLKNVLNVVNKINPATVLLRNGLLACMKLNIMNAAKRLRWSYLAPEKAAQKGIDAAALKRLVAVRTKLDKIFYGAGGKPSNLKNAILKGKGNKDKAVPLNGLGGFGGLDFAGIDDINIHTPLSQLLGLDMYYSENTGEGGADLMDGLGELGEPLTLASVGAAMGVVKAIVASLKKVGDIFKGQGKGAADFDEKTNEAAENNQPVKDTTTVPESTASSNAASDSPSGTDPNAATDDNTGSSRKAAAKTAAEQPDDSESTPPASEQDSSSATSTNTSMTVTDSSKASTPASFMTPIPATNLPYNDSKQGFWDKHKKWLKPVAIGVGGIVVIAIGYKLFHSGHPKNRSSTAGLSGPPHKRNKNHHRKGKSKQHAKKAIPLL